MELLSLLDKHIPIGLLMVSHISALFSQLAADKNLGHLSN
jgi:hypothetical protein